MEDSFIDDTDEALQAYLYSAYSRDDDFDGHDSNLDCEKIDTDDDGGSDTEDSDVEILPSRVSPYALRNKQIIHRRSSRSTINSFVRYYIYSFDVRCPSLVCVPSGLGFKEMNGKQSHLCLKALLHCEMFCATCLAMFWQHCGGASCMKHFTM